MTQTSRGTYATHRQNHGFRKKKNRSTSHVADLESTPADGRKKRIFKIPRRQDSRYSLQSGKTGSRLSLQEVFNRANAEYEGCSYKEDEPLSQADVYGINRDIRCHLYDIKKIRKGELTFKMLMKKYPVFLNELRSTIEKKWDTLQLCKAQWGVDWALQRVLQRDRLYRKTNNFQAVTSAGSEDAERQDSTEHGNVSRTVREVRSASVHIRGRRPSGEERISNSLKGDLEQSDCGAERELLPDQRSVARNRGDIEINGSFRGPGADSRAVAASSESFSSGLSASADEERIAHEDHTSGASGSSDEIQVNPKRLQKFHKSRRSDGSQHNRPNRKRGRSWTEAEVQDSLRPNKLGLKERKRIRMQKKNIASGRSRKNP